MNKLEELKRKTDELSDLINGYTHLEKSVLAEGVVERVLMASVAFGPDDTKRKIVPLLRILVDILDLACDINFEDTKRSTKRSESYVK